MVGYRFYFNRYFNEVMMKLTSMLNFHIKKFPILCIAVVQLGFSALDIYARGNLRGAPTFFAGMSKEWLLIWIILQMLIAPFQIKLILQNGLGKGVALMNGFSVLFALTGGYVFLNEAIQWNHIVSVLCVITAVVLLRRLSAINDGSTL